MRSVRGIGLTFAFWLLAHLAATAQTPGTPAQGTPGGTPKLPTAPAQTPLPPPPPVKQVAATVNNQPIYELALYRATVRFPAEKRTEARSEVLQFLTENLLIDQYLTQNKLTVDAKEVNARVEQVKAEVKKGGQEFDKFLTQMFLSETDLRAEIECALRWDKFVDQQATDKALRDLFEKNRSIFDGSQMRVRHILLEVPANNAQAADQAKVKLALFKKQLENQAATEVAKLPTSADNLTKEKTRSKALEDVFVVLAQKESACPSKKEGGDVGWFLRSGTMLEPFAKEAFSLKPFQLSNVIQTEAGYHLLLATDHRPGRETKFEEVRTVVRDVFTERLRELMVSRLRPGARIVLQPTK
jgi:peptidyl-prolyl cis-trans isomerase C